jgi:hypothetical protein
MLNTFKRLSLPVIAIPLFAGCIADGPGKLKWVKIDNSERDTVCVVLNSELQNIYSFENYQTRKLDHNRLRVIAELRNRTDEEQVIEVSTVFRDADKIVVDETSWEQYYFSPNQTLSYKISSVIGADFFTLRIRNINKK